LKRLYSAGERTTQADHLLLCDADGIADGGLLNRLLLRFPKSLCAARW
jgi:hypothetical protein